MGTSDNISGAKWHAIERQLRDDPKLFSKVLCDALNLQLGGDKRLENMAPAHALELYDVLCCKQALANDVPRCAVSCIVSIWAHSLMSTENSRYIEFARCMIFNPPNHEIRVIAIELLGKELDKRLGLDSFVDAFCAGVPLEYLFST